MRVLSRSVNQTGALFPFNQSGEFTLKASTNQTSCFHKQQPMRWVLMSQCYIQRWVLLRYLVHWDEFFLGKLISCDKFFYCIQILQWSEFFSKHKLVKMSSYFEALPREVDSFCEHHQSCEFFLKASSNQIFHLYVVFRQLHSRIIVRRE